MANDLGSVVTKYTERLDQIVEAEACTSDLNINKELLGELTRNGEIKIAKMSMDGLADHTRNGGFVEGGVTLEWETCKLEFERDRSFSIDVMDDEEREMILSAQLMAEFARTKVVPEVDAVRFARLCEHAGKVDSATFTDPADAQDAVFSAEEIIQSYGMALSDCILYVSAAMNGMLRKAEPWHIGQAEQPNTLFTTFDTMKLQIVPDARFATSIQLLDGKSAGEEAGGYQIDGSQLNFLIVHPSAAEAISKHETLRYFAPAVNQADECHLWQYRLYHDLFVYENKECLIYANAQAASSGSNPEP